MRLPPLQTSKCRWHPVEAPVVPLEAMFWPASTHWPAPDEACRRAGCARSPVQMPPPWSICT